MGLKNITHQDKLWVAFRLMPKDLIALCAADIAELVLPIFEAKYPNDLRPRKAIEAARSKDLSIEDKRKAAANAVYAAADAVYAAAAYAAANAAADAVYAAAANAAYAAANAAKFNGHNIEKQIRTIVLRYWK